MKFLYAPSASAVLASVLFSTSIYAQTYSKCNPLEQSCPANPALGGSTEVSFTSGSSKDFSGTGNGISYNSAGAQLSVAAQGDNPTLTSKWYIMFGHVDFVIKSAPGVGMVSSAILISDDLDEIDWEMLGADSSQAQTNYFGRGITGAYNQGSFIPAPTSQSDFNTYSVDWTSERILWQLNGKTVRTLFASDAGDQYPQTPMQVKVGSWAGGDPSNAKGTITWAGGRINYYDGPYTMQVQSVSAQDYSTGTAYQYSGTSGSWHEVVAEGGQVNPGGGQGSATVTTPTSGSASAALSSSTASYLASLGYNGHHRPSSSPSPSSAPTFTSSRAPVAAGCETIKEYNNEGKIYTVTAPVGWTKTWNAVGVLVTPPPCASATPTPAVASKLGGAGAVATTLSTVRHKSKLPSDSQSTALPEHGDLHSNKNSLHRDAGSDGVRTTVVLSTICGAWLLFGFAVLL